MNRNTQPMLKITLIALMIIAGISYALVSARMPQEFLVQNTEIDEASGLIASRTKPGILYTHNDSGGKNAVYVLNSMGQSLGRIVLEGIKNRDWEEIAIGYGPDPDRHYIYVGEIGDNRAAYKSIFIYRFQEPDLPADSEFVINIKDTEKIEINYEDGARDAEAFFVCPHTKDIYIISKREARVGLYHLSYPQSTTSINIAKRVAELPLSMVTAADISPDGKKILVKTYPGVWMWKVKRGQSISAAMQNKMKAMKYKLEPQGEAISWDSQGKGYFTLS